MDAFAFEARLLPNGPIDEWSIDLVNRTIALREDQTLEQLHEAMRLAFGWADPHIYAFWPGYKWWNEEAICYQAPFELDADEEGVGSARISIAELRLRKGSALAYVFDFGDEWRVLLKVVDRWRAEEESYPQLIEAEGLPPPQYPEFEEDSEPS